MELGTGRKPRGSIWFVGKICTSHIEDVGREDGGGSLLQSRALDWAIGLGGKEEELQVSVSFPDWAIYA